MPKPTCIYPYARANDRSTYTRVHTHMLTAFRGSDPEGTGTLPTVLLRLIVQHVNDTLTRQQLDQMETEVDPTASGVVMYENRDVLERIHMYID